jgi:protein pelota
MYQRNDVVLLLITIKVFIANVGLDKFYNQVYQAICQHIRFDVVKVLILASPGFYKDGAHKYIIDQALKNQNKSLLENRSKILLAHSSSGHKHALQELLQDPQIQLKLSDTKYAKEVASLDLFYKTLSMDPAKAFYGYEYVVKAGEYGAIDMLLVSDALFRSSDVQERKVYIQLVDQVKQMGGKVLLFSSLHTSGEQLTQLTGIAAILHYGMPELEEEVQEEQEKQRQSALIRKEDELVEQDLTVNLGY